MAVVRFTGNPRSGLRLEDFFTAIVGAVAFGTEGALETARFTVLVDERPVEVFYAGPAIAEEGGDVSYLRFGPESEPWLEYGDRNGPVLFSYEGLAGFHARGALAAADIMAGGDSLIGSAQGDYLEGYGGDDILNGGAGADTLFGGLGNDTFFVDEKEDRVFEAVGGGYDLVWALADYALAAGSEVEDLRAAPGTHGLALNGNAFSNLIVGTAGNDVLNGGAGIDTLIGGAGDDLYLVDNSLDAIWEDAGGGHDTVLTSASYALGGNLEILKAMAGTAFLWLGGNGLDNEIVGNTGADTIQGYDGNDRLYGDGGADAIGGGNGHDILYGGMGNDWLAGEAGNDVLYGDVGNDTLEGGDGADLLYGGLGKNRLYGGNGKDSLYGGSRADRLSGDNGNDALYGDAGRDILRGGNGRDTLSGGYGRDVFVFDVKPKKKNRDVITDFTVGKDAIWLDNKFFWKLGKKGSEKNPKPLNEDFFVTAAAAQDANDFIVYDRQTGYLFYDKDGFGSARPIMIAQLQKDLALTSGHFFVV